MNNFKGFGPYGFRPSEAELIGYLRNRTLLGRDCLVQDITLLDVDICKWEPWDLPGCTTVTSNDPVWYFIYPITHKHPNNIPNNKSDGKRKPINRVTSQGKWKVSGELIKVKANDSKVEIGIKTRLYFYTNSTNNEKNKKSKTKAQTSYQNKTPWVLYQYELIDVHPSQNKYFLGKLMKQSEPTNNSSSKGETSQQLPSNYLGNDHILTPEVQLDFHQEPLVEMEVSNDYDWIQNQSSISEQTNEFVNSFPVVYSETYPEERNNQDGGNKVNSNLQPFNLEYYVADYAIPQNPQVDYMRPITNPEGAQNQLIYTNQHDHSFQNVLIFNDETYPEERSNQHNIVAEDEGVNLPSNFYNDPIADISQMNLFDFDDLYWNGIYLHELKATDNNCDGVQNQSSINQQVADEFRNSNLIGNEIAYTDERNKSAAAEIEGSNLPSLGMTESSYPMESFRKGSGMEHEGSSTDIGTEVAQAQAKKRRF